MARYAARLAAEDRHPERRPDILTSGRPSSSGEDRQRRMTRWSSAGSRRTGPGRRSAGARILVVEARFYHDIADALLRGASEAVAGRPRRASTS